MAVKKGEELTIHRMKKAIANAFLTADFSAVDTYGKITHPDPKLLNSSLKSPTPIIGAA